MSEIPVVINASTGNAVASVPISGSFATPRGPSSDKFPPAIDPGQLYYWKYAWQSGEQESRSELAAGLGKTFDNPEDAIRWLLSTED